MFLAIAAFLATFVALASVGALLFYREAVLERLNEVLNPKQAKKKEESSGLVKSIQKSGLSISNVASQVGNVVPKSAAEMSVQKQRLVRAGYRDERAVNVFYGSKGVVPLALCLIVVVSGIVKLSPFFVIGSCLGLGFLVPDFVLGSIIKKRQAKMRKGLPDVLDLLVICVEAGLSLDQATARASEELHLAQPQLCDELGVVVLEQRAGRPRAEAWRNLAERTDVDVIKAFTSMLVQAEHFGTSVSKTLRTQSDSLRVKRVQQVEEQAAKLNIKLLFPLILCIFPALFLVVLGPAIINIMEQFKTYFGA